MATMQAVMLTKKGGPDVLETVELPLPEPGPSEGACDGSGCDRYRDAPWLLSVRPADSFRRLCASPRPSEPPLGPPPADMIASVGSGYQRLIVIPSMDLIIVRLGEDAKFSDGDFLRILLRRQAAAGTGAPH